MEFDSSLFEKARQMPREAMLDAIDILCGELPAELSKWEATEFDNIKYCHCFITAVIESFLPELKPRMQALEQQAEIMFHEQGTRKWRALRNLRKVLQEDIERIGTESLIDGFKLQLGTVFAYEFTEGDFKRVQQLINELRDELTKSTLFEEKHKQRLMSRLEKLQSELHKKVSNLDAFWGLVGDAGVALGKFGKDVKPLVDRIHEITRITWRTQSNAEGLQTGTPVPLIGSSNRIEPTIASEELPVENAVTE